MAIVSKRRNSERKVVTQINLQKLLLPTDFHPEGRVQLDPVTRMPANPRNNVLYRTKRRVHGREVEMDVNGGHAKQPGSAWRVALKGPARYFWKLMRDELAYRLRGSRSITAPKLNDEELLEARQFVAFLQASSKEGATVLPGDFLNPKFDHGMRDDFKALDEQFYKWLKKADKKDLESLPRLQEVFAFLPS